MNRIALATESEPTFTLPVKTATPHTRITTALRHLGRDCEAPYTTFTPIHYERGYAYPLLIWLHGAASCERELTQVMPHISMRNYVAIAPRGTVVNRRFRGRYAWRQTNEAIELAQSRIADCIAVAKRRFNVHPERIFLLGRDGGGTMAVRVAWNDPSRFAGIVTINGPLPTRLSPLRRVNELRRVPCLLTTARDNESYPSDRVCRDLRLLHVAGCTVALRQYPCAEGLTNNMLADLDRWLMELVCGSAQAS